jgi:hypothetical protein
MNSLDSFESYFSGRSNLDGIHGTAIKVERYPVVRRPYP